MAQGAWKDWLEGELVTEALFQDIQDSIAFIYSSESAANSALTRKVEGTQFFDTTANKLKIWNGSAWDAVGGKILQVVEGTDNTAADITSTSYVDTGLSVSITPSATSSKILVIVQHYPFVFAPGTLPFSLFKLLRDSTAIETDVPFGRKGDDHPSDNNSYLAVPLNMMKLDTPSTTSAITYKTQAKYTGTSSGYVTTAYKFGSTNTVESIVAIEVAG